jgi:hypothetical protein
VNNMGTDSRARPWALQWDLPALKANGVRAALNGDLPVFSPESATWQPPSLVAVPELGKSNSVGQPRGWALQWDGAALEELV